MTTRNSKFTRWSFYDVSSFTAIFPEDFQVVRNRYDAKYKKKEKEKKMNK